MPISSAEIAASVGQFQQAHSMNMAYGGLIGNMMNMPSVPYAQGEAVAGGLMNRGWAIGAPLAGFGLGMAGVDPISLGMRVGSFGARHGLGAMGAGALGLGAGFIGGTALAAGSYVANQAYTGASQQQAFNMAMRSNYNFITPGGQGFTTGQLGGMSGQLRGMAGEVGPQGQLVGFQELSSLAANMGRMGMAQNVRDVQDFGRRFKDMVDTLKVVAKEMGTSLGAAQEFVSAMRGSGIFNQADQIRAAGTMRGAAASGTLAVSELTAMGNIGSQISRAVGGRGRSGMFAGLKTMGQVGAAIDSGVLNEEDIYNATGLTGAEGRQAYSTAQMSAAASFLQTSKGRWFLASVAGSQGKLNQEAVMEWMGGGVGVGQTRGMAHANLARVGRAGFLRNEGRLRGAALEQFGGLLPVMALSSWADDRGIDINTMNDREMLFASRQLGIGMDQLNDMVKQTRNMPQIMDQMRMTQATDTYLRRIADQRRTQGLEGLKRKFEHQRERIQNSIQKAGADMYTDAATWVETQINRMSDVYYEQASKDVLADYRAATQGNREAGLRGFGIGFTKHAGLVHLDTSKVAVQRPSDYVLASSSGFLGLGTSNLDRLTQGGFGREVAKLSGWPSQINEGYKSLLANIADVQQGLTSDRGPSISMGPESAQNLREMYLRNISTAGGNRLGAGSSFIHAMASSDPNAASASAMLRVARTDRQRAGVVDAFERGMGVTPEARLASVWSPKLTSTTFGAAHSRDELARMLGSSMVGGQGSQWTSRGVGFALGFNTAVAWGSFGSAFGPWGTAIGGTIGALTGAAVGLFGSEAFLERFGSGGLATHQMAREAGEILLGKEAMGLARDLIGDNSGAQIKARSLATTRIEQLLSEERRTGNLKEGELRTYASMLATNEALRMMKSNKGPLESRQMAALSARYGRMIGRDLKESDIQAVASSMIAANENTWKANQRYTAGVLAEAASADYAALRAHASSLPAHMGPTEKRSASEEEFRTRSLGLIGAEMAGRFAGTDDPRLGRAIEGTIATTSKANELIANMSIAEQRAQAKMYLGYGMANTAMGIMQHTAFVQRASRSIARRNYVGAAGVLGVDLSIEEQYALRGMTAESKASLISAKLGLSGTSVEDAEKKLHTASLREAQGLLETPDEKAVLKKETLAARRNLEVAQSAEELKPMIKDYFGQVAKGDVKGAGETAAKISASTAFAAVQKDLEEKRQQNDPNLVALDKLGTKLDTIATRLGYLPEIKAAIEAKDSAGGATNPMDKSTGG